MKRIAVAVSIALLAAGCWETIPLWEDGAPDAGTDSDSDTDSDADSDSDSDVDTDSDTDIDTDSDTDIDTDLPDLVIPDTNQNQCTAYDGGWYWVDCDEIGEGDPLYGQDGHYRSPARQHNYSFEGDGTVVDEVTGLTWERCTAGLEGDDCAGGSVLTGPWEGGVYYCDDLELGGYDDWRLPSAHELALLFDYEGVGSAIDPAAFPNTVTGDPYFWSADEYVYDWGCIGTCYWTVNFQAIGSGPTVGPEDMATSWYGRCVHGEETEMGYLLPSSEDGFRVVRDLYTGLTWQGCAAGLAGDTCGDGVVEQLDWQGALAYCETLTWAGTDGWRLPDRNELASLVNYLAGPYTSGAPLVFSAMESSGLSGQTWTSSTTPDSVGSATSIDFAGGMEYAGSKANLDNVICVRDGA
jgi:hypothetical protein